MLLPAWANSALKEKVMYSKNYLKHAHSHCFANRTAIEKSFLCGCFECCSIFSALQVKSWIEERKGRADTGLCPYCDIDSIIGDYSHEINKSFLSAMNKEFFNSDLSSECVCFESFEELFNSYQSLG